MKFKIFLIITLIAILYSITYYPRHYCAVCAQDKFEVSPAKGFIEDTVAVTLATTEMELDEKTLKLINKHKVSLYEFGAGKCAQCKKMKPIIEELQKELEGKVEVKSFDTGVDREITAQHKIMLIPTQLFIDGEGKELFRHEGFYEKQEILNKLKELGIKL